MTAVLAAMLSAVSPSGQEKTSASHFSNMRVADSGLPGVPPQSEDPWQRRSMPRRVRYPVRSNGQALLVQMPRRRDGPAAVVLTRHRALGTWFAISCRREGEHGTPLNPWLDQATVR